MNSSWRSTPAKRGPTGFEPVAIPGLQAKVLDHGPRAPGIRGNEPVVSVNLPHHGIVAKITSAQATYLGGVLCRGIIAGRRGLFADYVALGCFLEAVQNGLPYGVYGTWLANSNVHAWTAEQALRLWRAFGDETGRVNIDRVVGTLREFGPPKWVALTAEALDIDDLNLSVLNKAAKAMERADKVRKSVGQNPEIPDSVTLRDDARAAEAANLPQVSLSSSAGGGSSPVGAFDLHSDRVAASVRSGGAGFSREQEVGHGAGGTPFIGSVGRRDSTAGAGGMSPRPPAGGPGRAEKQMTLDELYEVGRLCRDVAGRIERGELSAADVAFVAESLRLLGTRDGGGGPLADARGSLRGGPGGAVGAAAPTSRT